MPGLVEEVLNAFATLLDWDGDNKLIHARRTAFISAHLAEVVCPEKTEEILRAGLMHDIGTIGLPEHILHLINGLFHIDELNEAVLAHPWRGGVMLSLMGLNEEATIVRAHHEFWDGTGYPRGLQGMEIPQGARIVGLADYIDVLIYHNPQITREQLLKRIDNNPQFDPTLITIINRVLTSKLWDLILDPEQLNDELRRFWWEEKGFLDDTEELEQIDLIIEVLAQVIDCKHTYTAGHSYRVAYYAEGIGKALNLKDEDLHKLRQASLLHDLGKIAVPRRILDKPSHLSTLEWAIIKKHPVISGDIMQTVPLFKELAPLASSHHERFSGGGYPLGLKGEEIPYLARIITIADVFDALTSERPYKQTLSVEKALMILKESEEQFDPEILVIAFEVLATLGNEIWEKGIA